LIQIRIKPAAQPLLFTSPLLWLLGVKPIRQKATQRQKEAREAPFALDYATFALGYASKGKRQRQKERQKTQPLFLLPSAGWPDTACLL
jgi:hypothetical protein